MHVNMLTYINFKQVDKQVACLTSISCSLQLFTLDFLVTFLKGFTKLKKKISRRILKLSVIFIQTSDTGFQQLSHNKKSASKHFETRNLKKIPLL